MAAATLFAVLLARFNLPVPRRLFLLPCVALHECPCDCRAATKRTGGYFHRGNNSDRLDLGSIALHTRKAAGCWPAAWYRFGLWRRAYLVAMRYTLSPASFLVLSTVRPIFLARVPEMRPRIE